MLNLLLAWIVWVGVASALPAQPERLSHRGWTIHDGLPQSSVNDLVQTADGTLWIATYGGMARFDGIRFDVVDLAGTPGMTANRFLNLYADPAGVLWVGTQEHGLLRQSKDGFEAWPLTSEVDRSNVWGVLVDADGVRWVVSDAGLVRNDGGDVKVMGVDDGLPSTGVAQVIEDRGHTLWVGTSKGLARRVGSRFVPVGGPEPVIRMAPDPSDGVWVAREDGLWRHRAGEMALVAPHSSLHHPVDIEIDRRGRVWYTAPDGVHWYDGKPHQLALPGLEIVSPRSLLLDGEGSLWVGTNDIGLIQLWDRNAWPIDHNQGLPHGGKTAVIEDGEGTLWVGGDCEGIGRIRDGVVDIVPIGDTCVRALTLDRDGGLVVAFDEDVAVLRDGAWASLPNVNIPADALVRALYMAKDGALWMGGLGYGVTRDFKPIPGLEDTNPYVITEGAPGEMWVGTTEGLWRIQGEVPSRVDGVPSGTVRDVYVEDDGVVWLGTYGAGLARLEGGEVTRYTTAQGLTENVVSRIIDSGDGWLWVNGNRGVSRLSKSDLDAVADGQGTHVQSVLFDTGEGNGGGQPAGWRDRDGRLWFPTVTGVSQIDPAAFDMAESGPPVTIEEALLDGVPVAEGAVLEPGRRDLQVRFTAYGFVLPESTRFEYRLVGYDAEWRDAGAGRVATYTNLPPGSYRFVVKARNSAGLWSLSPSGLGFTLRPSLVERWWFAPAMWLFWGALAIGIVWGRLRAARRRASRLEREVDARVRTEAQLREREARYRTVFEHAANGFAIYDADRRLVALNPTACRMMDASPDTGENGTRTFVASDSLDAVMDLIDGAVRGSDGTADGHCLREGERFATRFDATPYQLSGKRGALLTIIDISASRRAEEERRVLEEQLQRAHTLEAIGQLAGGVAHDFNNLLTVIGGYAEITRHLGGLAESSAVEILACTARGSDLTRRLLAVGRRGPQDRVLLDLNSVIDGLEKMVRAALRDDITVLILPNPKPLAVIADQAQLERVVLNLALNAGDAMPDGGRLRIRTSAITLEEHALPVPEAHAGRYARLSVEDSGVGMTPQVLARVFEPFYTTKGIGDGSGLGLALVHSVVKQSGGFILANSRPGSGSMFHVYLPRVEAEVAEPVIEESKPRDALGPLRVLVCDDEPMVLTIAAKLLEAEGFEVLEASSGQQAIALARRPDVDIDLLLTDVMMPGMKGPELAEVLRGDRPSLPVIYMSGYTEDVLPADCEDPLVTKPFTRARLLDVVRIVL